MESPEKKFDDDYLYRMREEVLWKVEKSAELRQMRCPVSFQLLQICLREPIWRMPMS